MKKFKKYAWAVVDQNGFVEISFDKHNLPEPVKKEKVIKVMVEF